MGYVLRTIGYVQVEGTYKQEVLLFSCSLKRSKAIFSTDKTNQEL